MALAGELRQSTAVTVKIGPFPDSTDGNTDETGLTIAQADIRLSKNGGNMAQKNDATACTHDELSLYDCPLNTTDTNTLGILTLAVHESGALIVRHDYAVITAAEWDRKYSTGVQAVTVAAGGITAASFAASAIDANAIAADAITNSELAASAINEIRDAILSDSTAFAGANINATISSRASQTSVDTIDQNVDDIETRVITALPNAAPGVTGGLATFDNIFALADTGTVDDAGAAVGDFDGDSGLTATDDFYNGAFLVFTSGGLKGIARKISDYVGTSRNFAFSGAAGTADAPFPAAPSNGDAFVILGRHGA